MSRPRDERWEVVRGSGDDEWGVRRVGEASGMSIAQMVWYWDAPLIAACPLMYEFISKKAAEGDVDAARIIASL